MTSSFDTGIYAVDTHVDTRPPVGAEAYAYPRRNLVKGDVLYTLGDPAEYVFRLEEGLVKQSLHLLNGHERITALAGPGDYIGAVGLQTTYQDSAEVLSPHVSVSSIDVAELDEVVKDDLHHAAGSQLSHLRETIEDSELPVSARLARMFLRLGQRFGNVSEDDHVHITLPLTHENFAAMVGAARETTTALLGEMRAEGVISGTRGHYNYDHNVLSDYAVTASYQYS
ncbi:MAG: Crp/Fnr family transcriptional regulator [Deinococcota bacterium]